MTLPVKQVKTSQHPSSRLLLLLNNSHSPSQTQRLMISYPFTTQPSTMALTHTTPPMTAPLTLGPLTYRILAQTTTHSLAHLTLPPHTRGLPLLSNRLHSVTYHILSGTLRFSSLPGSNQALTHFDASTSSTITIPPGLTHGFGNGDAETVEVLCVFAPGEWVGALKELAGTGRESWKGILRAWGAVVFEGTEEGSSGSGESEEEDEEEELTHVPARLRCMAG